MPAPDSPKVFITWAHENTDWKPEQVREWKHLVGQFADVLMTGCGIDTEIDLWQSEPTDWTRWGPSEIRKADYVIIATSTAWKERFDGENKPTEGAGAAAEADELLGIYNTSQAVFRSKVVLVQLPGVDKAAIPGRLHGISRFRISDVTVSGLEELVRHLTGQPRYLRPTRGRVPTLPAEQLSPTVESPRDQADTPQAVYDTLTRGAYLERSQSTSDARHRFRRRGVGLDDAQIERTLAHPATVPADIIDCAAGEMRLLTAALGAGKSDVAEQWHQANIERALDDPDAAIPVWFSVDDLTEPLERAVVDEVGRPTLARLGVDVVIDGLDERTDRAPNALRQATEFLARWPLSRIVLTSRATLAAKSSDVVRLGPITPDDGLALASAVAGRSLYGANIDQTLLQRPLFALLVGQHIDIDDGVAGVAELIDTVVGRVVESDSFDLYVELKRLAVETTRNGGPVDPSTFTTAAAAAQIRKSPMITVSDRACAFSLATFEQWFASKALLEGDIDTAELLSSLVSFNRWKYVFASVFAAGDPVKVDPIMTTLVGWNPGAAAWVIKEARDSGLIRPRPVLDADDWERVGWRLRTATSGWLKGLGPLSSAFCMFAHGAASTFDDTALAVDIDKNFLHVTWLGASQVPDALLPPVLREVPSGPDGQYNRTLLRRSGPLPVGVNWVWETAQKFLADDLKDRFKALVDRSGISNEGVVRDEFVDDRRQRFNTFGAGDGKADPDNVALYPGPDRPPTATAPFGAYSSAGMKHRVELILSAAMKCYVELTELLTPSFGKTLAHRGMMPLEFYGVMFHDPDTVATGHNWGYGEPGFRWLLKPIATATPSEAVEPSNRVSLALNDNSRSEEINDQRASLYREFRSYVEANPAYEPFAGSFTTTSGQIDVLKQRPATRIAAGWLAEDLARLGFLPKSLRTTSW